jgi:pimeloyl-ACP methyl ester carboxylesterase
MPHLIILLPGIMGSALQKDGKDLWALSGQALWQHLLTLGKRIGELNIHGDDWQRNDLGDGVRAVRLIEDLHSIPPLVEHAGYSVIRKGISDFFGLTEGSIEQPDDSASFFTFPYDWRRDNRAAARELQEFIQKQLPRWREYSGAKKAQVILIGHSMGGLIARYYLEVLGGWRDTCAAITVGSPHRGAIGALDTLSNGFKKLNINFASLSSLVQSFPSAYQLLPTYPALGIEGRYMRPTEADAIPNVDLPMAKSGREDFLEAIRLAAMENARDPDYVQKLIPWVGTRQDTLQSASIKDGKLELSYDGPPGLDSSLVDGDGTVPRVCAVPADLDGKRFERFSVERHGWLTNNPMTLQPLLDTLLQISSPGAPTFFGVGEPEVLPASINLRLDRLFLPDEPVGIQMTLVDAGEQPQGIELSVKPVGHTGEGAAKTVQASSAEPARVEFGGLVPGLYELTAAAQTSGPKSPTATHAVFEVVDPAAIE